MISFSLNIHKGTLSLLFLISLFYVTSLSACLLLARTSHAQWAATYGGAAEDGAVPTQQTSDGGYLVAGWTESFGAGSADLWALKLDSIGVVQWQKTYGGGFYEEAHSFQQTNDGGYIVAGEAGSFDVETEGDFWILKLDSNGNVQWQKTYGGNNEEGLTGSIQQTSDDGYILACRTSSFGAGEADIWVLKLESSGRKSMGKSVGRMMSLPSS